MTEKSPPQQLMEFVDDEDNLEEATEIDFVDEYGYRRNLEELSGHNAGLASVRRQREWWNSEFPSGIGAVEDSVAQRWRTHSTGRLLITVEVDSTNEKSATNAQPKRRPSLTNLNVPKEKDTGTFTFLQ